MLELYISNLPHLNLFLIHNIVYIFYNILDTNDCLLQIP